MRTDPPCYMTWALWVVSDLLPILSPAMPGNNANSKQVNIARRPITPPVPAAVLTQPNIILILDEQKKIFNDVLDRTERANVEHCRLYECELNDIKKSLEFIQVKVDGLTDKFNALTQENKYLFNEITTLKQKALAAEENIVNHQDCLAYQEDQSRRNNLHISGLPEEVEETC